MAGVGMATKSRHLRGIYIFKTWTMDIAGSSNGKTERYVTHYDSAKDARDNAAAFTRLTKWHIENGHISQCFFQFTLIENRRGFDPESTSKRWVDNGTMRIVKQWNLSYRM